MAYLNDEPGADAVAAQLLLGDAFISAVNFGEVMSKVFERGTSDTDAADLWRRLSIAIEPVTDAVALRAARLRPLTRSLGLSMGDRCCLALAAHLGGATIVTADRAWKSLKGYKFIFIR